MSYSEQQLNEVFNKAIRLDGDFTHGCIYCNRPISRYVHGDQFHSMAWQVDHAIPRSRGGIHSIVNWYPACNSCNQTKGDKLPSEFTPSLLSMPTSPSQLLPRVSRGLVAPSFIEFANRLSAQSSIQRTSLKSLKDYMDPKWFMDSKFGNA
jgi:hypothetical protein